MPVHTWWRWNRISPRRSCRSTNPTARAGIGLQLSGRSRHTVEADERGIVRYRCRVGHVYSAESMLAAQTDSVDRALWTALRSMEGGRHSRTGSSGVRGPAITTSWRVPSTSARRLLTTTPRSSGNSSSADRHSTKDQILKRGPPKSGILRRRGVVRQLTCLSRVVHQEDQSAARGLAGLERDNRDLAIDRLAAPGGRSDRPDRFTLLAADDRAKR